MGPVGLPLQICATKDIHFHFIRNNMYNDILLKVELLWPFERQAI